MKNLLLIVFLCFFSIVFSKQIDLTLSDAIEMAYENDYNLKNSRIDITNSDLKVKEAYKDFLPKFDVGSTMNRNEEEIYNNDSDKTEFENEITLSQPVYKGGSLMASLRSQKKNLKISEINLEIVRDNLRIEVITKYVDVLKEIKNKELYERSYKEIKEQYDLAENKYQLELIPLTEVLPLKTNLININTQIIQTENSIKINKSDLKNLLGIPRETEINLTDTRLLVDGIEQIDLNDDILNSRENGREIRVSEFNIEISKENEKKSFSNFLPQVDFSAGYTATDEHFDESADEWNWNIELSAKMNIFSFGQDIDAYERSKNETKQYSNNKLQKQDDLETEIRNNYLNLITAKRTIEANVSALSSAKENVLLERERYENDLTNAIDYLQVENAYIESEIDLSNSILDYYLSYEIYLNSLR